jgi:hypothetical protein
MKKSETFTVAKFRAFVGNEFFRSQFVDYKSLTTLHPTLSDNGTPPAKGSVGRYLLCGSSISRVNDIETIAGTSAQLTLAYKSEVDGGKEEGAFAGSYKTTYDNTPTDPSAAKIEYESGPVITGNPIYLLAHVVRVRYLAMERH